MEQVRTARRLYNLKKAVENLCSVDTGLKFAETIFGSICFGLMLHYTSQNELKYFYQEGHELLTIMVSFACLLTTFLLLLAALWSLTSSSLLSRASFEVLYHFCACVLYLAVGITLLTKTIDRGRRRFGGYTDSGYDARIAAAVFAIINGCLYLCGFVTSFRIFRKE